jgi:hypothetical protein
MIRPRPSAAQAFVHSLRMLVVSNTRPCFGSILSSIKTRRWSIIAITNFNHHVLGTQADRHRIELRDVPPSLTARPGRTLGILTIGFEFILRHCLVTPHGRYAPPAFGRTFTSEQSRIGWSWRWGRTPPLSCQRPTNRAYQKRNKYRQIYRYLPLQTLSNVFRVNSRRVDGDRVKVALRAHFIDGK